jgi:hypothetical protein
MDTRVKPAYDDLFNVTHSRSTTFVVMPGLVPGIHVFLV